MDFCLLLEIWVQIGKNITKKLSSKYSQKFLIMLNNLLHMQLKLFQKEQFKKQQVQLVIWLEIKLLIKLCKFQKLDQWIIQKVNEEEILRKRFIPSELRHKIIDDLRLKKENCWCYKINKII